MAVAVMVLFYLLFPALVIWFCVKYPLVNRIGAVILCYIGGVVFGNLGLIPASAASLQNTLTEALIAVGISLLLFTIDIGEWRRTAGRAILSFGLATVAIIVVAFAAVAIFRGSTLSAWKLGGMAIGLYTGGTPNLASIKEGLGVDNDSFILMHTYDTLFSLIYILFSVSFAQRFFSLFLRRFAVAEPAVLPAAVSSVAQRPAATSESAPAEGAILARPPAPHAATAEKPEAMTSFIGIFRPRVLLGLGGALFLAIAVAVCGLLVSSILPASVSTAAAILTITTLSIALSFVKRVRTTPKSFQFGMYFIYMFCTVVASMVRLSDIVHINWPLLGFVALCIFGSMALHSILCVLFRIDVDTFIITSVSAICSPPFVPVVAAGLRNHLVLVSGITTGIIGYAIGNYLGISVAFLMR